MGDWGMGGEGSLLCLLLHRTITHPRRPGNRARARLPARAKAMFAILAERH
jgi:hypothetical protein